MSTAFTTPAATNWRTCLLELANAYSERRQAVGLSAYTASSRSVQSAAFWRMHQEFCDNYCTLFVDLSTPLPGLTSMPYFSLASFRAAAGLNASGFARKDVNGNVLYGHCQQNDTLAFITQIRELQAAYSVLVATWRNGSQTGATSRSASGGDAVCATARAAHDVAWNAASWISPTAGIIYMARGWATTSYGFYSVRGRGQTAFSGIPTDLPQQPDVYAIPRGAGGTYLDMDGYGMTQNKLWLHESLGAMQVNSFNSSILGDINTSPVDTIPINCPISAWTEYGISLHQNDMYAVLNWDFTYCN